MAASATEALTIPQVAALAAQRFGDAPALIDGDLHVSFAELNRLSRLAAAAFVAHGTVKGDVIAIWAPNRLEWILAAIGAQIAGAILTPLNTRMKGREAADILRRSRTRILFTVGDFLGTDYPALLTGEDLPDLKTTVLFDRQGREGWDAFLAEGYGIPSAVVQERLNAILPTDPCDILFTSGTTGAPKGVVSAHGQTVELFRSWGKVVDLREADRFLIVNPFFHTFGYKAGWLAALIAGATILPMAVFDAAELARRIRDDRVTFIPGPPTIYQSLLAELAERGLGEIALRVAVTGAATVPPVLVERMRRELGFETVITGYGMTECGVITMCRMGDSIDRIANSCGIALPGLELRIVNDEGFPLPAGETGEILVRGYGVMQGYLDDPQASAEAIDTEGWLHTGDVGVQDQDGYLRITDRKKDMYISGGFNCYPAEIEKLLCAHPAIEMAAVIGVGDERMGEVGKAFVVLRPGRAVDKEELRSWARENMANYKVPRFFEIVPDLPRNAAGKVMRIALRPN